MEIHDNDAHKDIIKCSVGQNCYDFDNDKYVNNNCVEENESCGKIVYFQEGDTGETTETHHCINTNFCTADINIFGFGPAERKLKELACPDTEEKLS
jgi:hypothetical protein